MVHRPQTSSQKLSVQITSAGKTSATALQAAHARVSLNFQQLRSVRETVRQGFNLTTVAEALHTSQPGVSRQIRDLEDR